MVKKVSIKIKGGKISADFTGFKGQECKNLEQRLRMTGTEVESTDDKPELFQQQSSTATNGQTWN